MPFGSYEQSKEQAFASCARVMKETGCGAIKLEGGRRMAETIAFLAERGVPVMGHVGLTPQSINTIGSFRAQGRDEADWAPIEADAKAVADAGAFSIVIEAVAEPLGRKITGQVAIPTIGIGASPPATARSWCWRTCSACRRGFPNSSAATGSWGRASRRRSRPMPGTSGRAPSRARNTSTRCEEKDR